MITELMSTLAQRHLSSFTGRHQRVRVSLAERPLARRQARNPVTDDAGAERDDGRQRPVHEEEHVKVDDGGLDSDTPRTRVIAMATESTRCTPATNQSPN